MQTIETVDPCTGRVPGDTGPLLTTRAVCARYGGVASRTIERWLANKALGFPRPITINRRRFFRLQDLEDWERRRVATAAA